MERTLSGMVYLFFGLSAVHWCHLSHVLRQPPGCGNVITDPLLFLINVAGPLAALCGTALLGVRARRRQRPFLPTMVVPLFLGTAAALGYEVLWLRDYGINLSHAVWWLPGL